MTPPTEMRSPTWKRLVPGESPPAERQASAGNSRGTSTHVSPVALFWKE